MQIQPTRGATTACSDIPVSVDIGAKNPTTVTLDETNAVFVSSVARAPGSVNTRGQGDHLRTCGVHYALFLETVHPGS